MLKLFVLYHYHQCHSKFSTFNPTFLQHFIITSLAGILTSPWPHTFANGISNEFISHTKAIYPSSLRFKFRCYVISLRCMLDIGYNAFFCLNTFCIFVAARHCNCRFYDITVIHIRLKFRNLHFISYSRNPGLSILNFSWRMIQLLLSWFVTDYSILMITFWVLLYSCSLRCWSRIATVLSWIGFLRVFS